mmetsp:Transcript_131256/g.292854  ORF Transcript_131256/g.292854 Transcript_131256/m.292854 type:complete len:204 (-) Transcript_131256:57-668(-)
MGKAKESKKDRKGTKKSGKKEKREKKEKKDSGKKDRRRGRRRSPSPSSYEDSYYSYSDDDYSYSGSDSRSRSRGRDRRRGGRHGRDRDRGRGDRRRGRSEDAGGGYRVSGGAGARLLPGARRSPPRRPLQQLGNMGSGDHKADLEEFITSNELDSRTQGALEALSEDNQKKVMGTDGGENSFVLKDKVMNPNAVVMSRIRRMN